MHAVARLLFPVPDLRRSTTTLFAWWERRRPVYNAIVGGAGLLTLATIQLIGWLPPHLAIGGPPLVAVVLYGLAANVCYTFGFAFEALLQRIWGNEVAPIGPTLWRHGLVFSVGLTLLPIGVLWVVYLANAVRWLIVGAP